MPASGDQNTETQSHPGRAWIALGVALCLTSCGSPDAVEAAPTDAAPVVVSTPTTRVAELAAEEPVEALPPVVIAPIPALEGADPTPQQLGEYGFYPTTTMPAAFFEPVVIRVEPLPGTLALTFDDGPDPEWTPIILDILKERGVKATFFVLGWKVDAYPDLARRIVDEGHSLQSHAYRHHNLTNRSDAAVGALLDDAAEAIFNATGTTPVCVRPPGGITSNRLYRVAAEHGHLVVLWSPKGNSLDYSHKSTSGVIRRAKEWEAGDVTLMHDIWGWLHRDALPVILDDLDSRGIGYSTICVPTR